MSGWQSKKKMSNSRFEGVSYQFTQPYTNWNQHIPLRIAKDDTHRQSVNVEMSVLAAVDNIVDQMKSYPEAEQLLKSILTSD